MTLPFAVCGGDAVKWVFEAVIVSHITRGAELVLRASGALPLETTDSLLISTTTIATHIGKTQSCEENQTCRGTEQALKTLYTSNRL